MLILLLSALPGLAGPTFKPLDAYGPPVHKRVEQPPTCQPHDGVPDPAKAVERDGQLTVPGLTGDGAAFLNGWATFPGARDGDPYTRLGPLADGFTIRGLEFACASQTDHVLELIKPGGERLALYTQVVRSQWNSNKTSMYLENYVWAKGGWEHRHRVVRPKAGKAITLNGNNPCVDFITWEGDRLVAMSRNTSGPSHICVFDELGALQHHLVMDSVSTGETGWGWASFSQFTFPDPNTLLHKNSMTCQVERIGLAGARAYRSWTAPKRVVEDHPVGHLCEFGEDSEYMKE